MSSVCTVGGSIHTFAYVCEGKPKFEFYAVTRQKFYEYHWLILIAATLKAKIDRLRCQSLHRVKLSQT